ncbi:hypothetical protein CB1_000305006 [Camelus ferus]|nr:hypothetical protein CB1_000305006 [Camelus ferus]
MRPAAWNESGTSDFVLLGLGAPPSLRPLLWAALLVAYLATVLGNGALVGLIALDRRLHRPMYRLLAHLALLDTARHKLVAVFYLVVTPVLNPLIYSLRNREVHAAARYALARLRGSRSELR